MDKESLDNFKEATLKVGERTKAVILLELTHDSEINIVMNGNSVNLAYLSKILDIHYAKTYVPDFSKADFKKDIK